MKKRTTIIHLFFPKHFLYPQKLVENYIDIYGSNYIELRAYYVNDIDYYGMKMRETYAVSDDVDE